MPTIVVRTVDFSTKVTYCPPSVNNVTMVTGCPVDLMKFVAAKSVEIPEGKVIMIG